MDILKTMHIASGGLRAQTSRMQVLAENIANADSTATRPGEEPYRRRIPVFETVMNREMGVETVKMSDTVKDMSNFGRRHDPSHPAADEAGYVATPNVSTLIEMMDMRQAQRSYEANLNVIDSARAMLARTVDLLRR